MKNIKISFIVPVYNCENYLAECLESLVNQTIDSKEIILLNDGSTDGSLKICNEYALKHGFIKVFNKKNEGLSATRNLGVTKSCGKYIQFVDSDDFINIQSGEKFYQLCETHNLDMIRGKYHVFYEAEGINVKSIDLSAFKYLDKPVQSGEYFMECINSGMYEVTSILGLFKKEFYLENRLEFTTGITMEDHEFTLKSLTINLDARVMQIDYDFYTYRRRENSITTSPKISNIQDITKGVNLILTYINESSFTDELKVCSYKAASALLYQATSVYGRLDSQDKRNAKNMIPKEILKIGIKYPASKHQKIKLLLFTHFRTVVDLVYKVKLGY